MEIAEIESKGWRPIKASEIVPGEEYMVSRWEEDKHVQARAFAAIIPLSNDALCYTDLDEVEWDGWDYDHGEPTHYQRAGS